MWWGTFEQHIVGQCGYKWAGLWSIYVDSPHLEGELFTNLSCFRIRFATAKPCFALQFLPPTSGRNCAATQATPSEVLGWSRANSAICPQESPLSRNDCQTQRRWTHCIFPVLWFSHLCDKFHVLKTVWLTSLCRRMEGPESSHQSGRVWVETRDHPLTSVCPQGTGRFWLSPNLQSFFCAENESLFCNESEGLSFSFMSL